ncbi:MAG: threonine synthase [Gemmatimonadaceae bacterium]
MTPHTAVTQLCDNCGTELSTGDTRTQCAKCGGLLSLRYDPPKERAAALRNTFDARLTIRDDSPASSGVWRFRELVLPDVNDAEILSQPEGNTPLVRRERVAAWCGLDSIHLKLEGANPTGSFKDRGMTVAVTQARRISAPAVACASTGNTSASLAAYAALAGLPALVLVPKGQVSLGKLSQTIAYGARTLLVRGDFDDCLRLARAAADTLGVYLANSINPYRIAGQKTIVFEMLQQVGWQAPDWIVLPAGNLGNTAAFGAALREAKELGLIDSMPRLAAVQAAGAAPFAASFDDDFRERHKVRAETAATAIRIGDPASYDRAVRAIRETNGIVIAVSDADILDAKAVVDSSGVGCEPASAASVAGTRELVGRGVIRRNETVVGVLTGHILKDSDILLKYHRDTDPPPARANRPIEIDADIGAVERVLATARRSEA